MVKGLNSNVHHQLITSPAALSGLLTLSVNVSERPSLIITVPSQGTPMGLPQQVFVSKYLINLPSEKELQMIIEQEREK